MSRFPSAIWSLSTSLLLAVTVGCTPTYYQPAPYYSPNPATPSYPAAPGYPVTSLPVDPVTGPIASNPGYPSIPATPPNPASPSGPVVMNPDPPNTLPVSTPTNNPVPIPTSPGTSPTAPSSPAPPPDITAQWAPWPMPPKSNVAVASTQQVSGAMPGSSAAIVHSARKPLRGRHRHLSLATRPGSHAERTSRMEASLTTAVASAAAETTSGVQPVNGTSSSDDHQLVDGANPTPMEDLRYRGGKMLQNMGYVNLYISGEQGWNMNDVNSIDRSLAAAMKDEHLNNVIRQYFNNEPIGTTVYPSHPLVGYIPKTVSRGDLQYFVQYLYGQGYLSKYDLGNTVFNFLCPPGTILSDDDARSGSALTESPLAAARAQQEEDERPDIPGFPESEAEIDSMNGLGGYHGSIHIGNQTIYYSAEVFSESRPDGFKNGIPAFPEGWKNTVATMYHELQEARTDPDVEDVIRNPYQPNIVSKLGWTSDAGEEIGDFPLHDNVSIRTIIQDVPLADGSGTVPIQLQYSNAVHGPEGPIPQLHAPATR